MLRWLQTIAYCYPGFLLAGVLMVSAPVLSWELASTQTIGIWNVHAWGLMPQSPRLNELLSARPGQVLAINVALLAVLAFLAKRPGRHGAVLVCPASLLLLPYWVYSFSADRPASILGTLVALLGTTHAQRMLLPAPPSPYWRRFLASSAPLLIGFWLGALLLGGRQAWFLGAWAALPLLTGAGLASFLPAPTPTVAPSWRSIALGFLASAVCYQALQFGAQSLTESRHRQTQSQLAQTADPSSGTPYPTHFFQRGVSLVADRAPFGSDVTHQLLRDLAAHGVDSIGIVVHGIKPRPPGDRESHVEIELLARRAHALGMRVLLKPHHHPRADDLSSDAKREAWFRRHREGIEEFGRLATRIHADLFCIGYEMGKAYQYERDWRAVIQQARAVYPGPLTACPTQGEEFEGIQFWDALDYIGIDNYYPVPDSYDYTPVVRIIERVQQKYQKPVLFTEAGFASVTDSHREPWAEPRRALSLEEQERCYRVLFEALYHKPWFMGMYWWKVDTDGHGGAEDRSLTPWSKPAMELVKRWYTGPARR